jgi:BirA family transcriptional regulator, biotin operon repressor / biotin---[acetyl-CoA-carboxylase] ligase
MRAAILGFLRNSEREISGEVLGKELGISRVSIWKHIVSLRQAGYIIEASPQGYRLLSSPDLLLDCEFPELEKKLYHFHTIGSTMDAARDLIENGAGEGTIVVAESQSNGRGRLGREWFSPQGGIYFTLILKPQIAPAYAPRLNLMASVAVAKTLRRLLGLDVRLKWPNDVLIEGRKVCGILAEMKAEVDALKYVTIGVGINANLSIAKYGTKVASLKELKGHEISRKEIFISIVKELLEQQPLLAKGALIEEWRTLSATLNREVRIETTGGTIAGRAVDIDSSGALIIKGADGSLRTAISGDCFHL